MMIQLSAGTTYQFPITSGSGLALTLSAITLTDSAGTVTTQTATGQTLNIAVPTNAASGVGAINYSYNDGSGVTAGTPIPVTIVSGSVPSTGAQQVLLGGKLQLSPPAGFTFGANPTLTLSNAAGTVVFGPNQAVDDGSATDLPTWTLTNVPLGAYTGVADIVIDNEAQQIPCAINVVSSFADPMAADIAALSVLVAATQEPVLSASDLTGLLIKYQTATVWTASTAYKINDRVISPSSNGRLYTCVKAGTSGAAEPCWPKEMWRQRIGATFRDGVEPFTSEVVWEDDGAAPDSFFDMNGAAHDGWMRKAAILQAQFDFASADQKFSLNQQYQNALTMAASFAPSFLV